MNKYFIYGAGGNESYVKTSIAAGGNQEAWVELAKNGLIAEISFLEQYLRQKSRCFCMNPADFRSLENPLVD